MSNPRTHHHSPTPPHLFSLILGPAISGITEIVIFHPVDTISKRLQKNNQQGLSLKQIILAEKHRQSYAQQVVSIYQGGLRAVAYKGVQRIYKFGGQPIVKSALHKSIGGRIEERFGKKHGKVLIEAIAGSIIGVGEVALLPLDALKVRKQLDVKPLNWSSKTVISNFKTLYRGVAWTAARNAPGSFCLFGCSAVIKEYLFGLQKYHDATLLQEAVASTAGGICSVTVTNPMDVVKTRIQAEGGKKTGSEVIRHIIHHEGFFAFGKGVVPKVLAAAPKVAFSMTIANSLIKKIDSTLQKTGTDDQLKLKKP